MAFDRTLAAFIRATHLSGSLTLQAAPTMHAPSNRSIPLLLASLMAASACKLDNRNLDAADRYFNEKQYAKAIEEYSTAVDLVEKSPAATRQLGLSYSAVGDWAHAIKFLEVSEGAAPSDTTVRLALGSAYVAAGRSDDARREATAVLALAPRSLSALNMAGSAYLAKQQPDTAIQYFQRLVSLSPRDPKGKYLLGLGLLARNEPQSAATQFESALALSPKYLDPLTQLVAIDLTAGRSGEALARVKKQISAAGSTPQLDELLALIYLGRHEQALAEATLLSVMKQSPTYLDPYIRLSELYRTEGKLAEAIDVAEKALKLDPNNLSVYLVLGASYEAKGYLTKAEKTYEDALAINPRFAAAANNLANILAETGTDLDRALAVSKIARTAEPNNPAILDTYGWILYKRGDNVEAVRALTVAASHLPGQPTVAYHLGVAQIKAGDIAAARKTLRQAVSSPSAFPEKSAAQSALASLK